MRYKEQKSVVQVVDWLKDKQCEVTGRAYHGFMLRVLRLMPLKQAEALGVDPSLLRAIRIRLKLPLDPKGKRVAVGKGTERYDHRRRRRRLASEPKSRPSAPPPTRPRRVKVSPVGQMPLTGILETTDAEISAFQRFNRAQLREVNEQATAKVRAMSLEVYTNVDGRCFHIKTKREYTPEELQSKFSLSYAEAQSLFKTVD